jgi:hypothetical protein
VSDLGEGGSAVGETALLLDDEGGARLEALELELDDTGMVGVEDEVGNDDATMDIEDITTAQSKSMTMIVVVILHLAADNYE